MSDVMIDLETLSVTPESVLLTLAAVKFNPHNTVGVTDELYHKLNVDEQIAQGREVNDDTLLWWFRQPQAVQDDAMSEHDRITVKDSLTELTKFLVGVNDIWCQGPVFDIVILENLYRSYGMHFPWSYWQIRDSRTLFKFLSYDPRAELRKLNSKAHHNALDDAIIQACAVQKCYKLLKNSDLAELPR
jgi:hypothetical protein